jgi:hypothetical protein
VGDVFDEILESGPFPFILAEHMFVRLWLEPRSKLFQNRIELGTKELDRIPLIASVQDAHPQQVNVVGHATVDGAAQAVSEECVGQDLAKFVIEDRNQPAGLAVVYGQGPVDIGLSTIVFRRQPPQVVAAVNLQFHLGDLCT